MNHTRATHLPRRPGGQVLDDDAVVGLPARRVAAADGAAASAAAGRGSSEASSATSALTGQFHANPAGICNELRFNGTQLHLKRSIFCKCRCSTYVTNP